MGLEKVCRDSGGGKGQGLGSRGRAERNWAMGSDLESGAGKLAGCWVLKTVSEDLPF